jgi:hypothetical protein
LTGVTGGTPTELASEAEDESAGIGLRGGAAEGDVIDEADTNPDPEGAPLATSEGTVPFAGGRKRMKAQTPTRTTAASATPTTVPDGPRIGTSPALVLTKLGAVATGAPDEAMTLAARGE